MVHPAKVDLPLLLMTAAGILTPVVMGFYHLLAPGADPQLGRRLLFLGAFIGTTVICLAYPINYEVRPAGLMLRSGIIRWSIPLSSIEEVKPVHGLKLAFAVSPSLDRMEVTYLQGGRRRTVHISPLDQRSFLHDLATMAPGLRREGEGLVRASPDI